MSNDDEFIRAAQEAIETHRDTFQKLPVVVIRNYIAELEEQLADLQLAKSHLWADKQFLEAQCAALREALMSAAYYYEPATTVLSSSDAGAGLLKRLQLAEAVCETFYSDYFEAINIEEDEEDFPDWCVAYRKWRELKTGECAIHMEKCDCKAKGE